VILPKPYAVIWVTKSRLGAKMGALFMRRPVLLGLLDGEKPFTEVIYYAPYY